MRKYLIALVILAVVGGGAAFLILRQSRASAVAYRTESASRGDLLATISGTGTLEPEDVVDVGAQVPGLIRSFGTDTAGKPVNYGSQVEEGSVLAQIDDRMFVAKADQSRALVKSAEQKVSQAKAKADAAVANTKKARALLEKVGLGERLYHHPSQLSGGQQQRVAIARSLINDPPLLLADEPTGNLDSKTSVEILEMFKSLHRDEGLTILLVTHDPAVARSAERIVFMRDGVIESGAFAPERAAAA